MGCGYELIPFKSSGGYMYVGRYIIYNIHTYRIMQLHVYYKVVEKIFPGKTQVSHLIVKVLQENFTKYKIHTYMHTFIHTTFQSSIYNIISAVHLNNNINNIRLSMNYL